VADEGTLVIGTNIAAEAGGTRSIEVPVLTLAQVASLVPTPGLVDFGGVATGASVTRKAEVRNLGGFDLTLTGADFDGTGSDDFGHGAGVPAWPLTLAPNAVLARSRPAL
jgi:hypothetical protein